MSRSQAHTASFRDPSGQVFFENNVLYRDVHSGYKKHYDLLLSSGLYEALTQGGLLIPHIEVSTIKSAAYKVLQPEVVPFISYPYEWSFSQLHDAALLTLKIQKIALEHGMMLKDGSAYNIQFHKGAPILIDTLSFETHVEGAPWIAYGQFCRHFLAPLALMAHVDIRLGTLSAHHLDGVPLDLARQLLPRKTKFSFGLGTHLHLHAKSQQSHAADGAGAPPRQPNLPRHHLLALLQSLESTVRGLRPPRQATEWNDYYDNTNYSQSAQAHKQELVATWIKVIKPRSAWDAGANDGTFSRLASSQGIPTIASDIDPLAVEHGYQQVKKDKEELLLPLVIDLTNPSPAIGWNNTERDSFLSRIQVDVALCLAFVHHLAISNNLPLEQIAALFAAHAKNLLIEFVPKEDSNTQRLLATREDIFPNYTTKGFEAAFSQYFVIKEKVQVKDSSRCMYYLKQK